MKNSLYVAITHHDWSGYDYLKTAIEQGVGGVVLEKSQQYAAGLIPDNIDIYLVNDCRQFLIEITQEARTLFEGDVLAITGSTGKSQTGLWIHHVLSNHFRTQFNADNRNSFFGLCELLLHIKYDTQKLVVELGARQLGEMTLLAELLKPQTVLLTNIQHSHLKYLKNIQNVLQLKSELVAASSVENVFLNASDPLQSALPEQFPDKKFHFYKPDTTEMEIPLMSPHLPIVLGAVRSIADFYDAEPLPRFDHWPQPHLGLQLLPNTLDQQMLLDGRVTNPESLENFRQTLIPLLQKNSSVDAFALIGGFADIDPRSEAAFIKIAAYHWSGLKLKKIYYAGAQAELFKKHYLENGGRAELILGPRDSNKILDVIKSFPAKSLIAVQGLQEEWFYELANELISQDSFQP